MSFWNNLGDLGKKVSKLGKPFTPNRWFEYSGKGAAQKLKEGLPNIGLEAAKALGLKAALKEVGFKAAEALKLEGSMKSIGADAATILNLKDSLENAGLSAATKFGSNIESGLRDIGLSSSKELTGLINGFAFKYAIAQSLLYFGDYILNYVKSSYLADNYLRHVEFLIDEKLFLDALETIDKAIEIYPNNPLYRQKKADILFELKKFGESAVEYKHALAFAGNDKILENNLLLSLSSLYYNLQRYDESILQLNKIITSENHKFINSSIYYYNIGSCYEKKEDFIQAAQFFQKAINIDSEKFEYFARLGFVKGKIGLFVEAIKDYNRALVLNPSDQKTLLYLGLAFIELRNYNEAIIVLDKLVNINSISEYYVARGLAYLLIGNEHSAETNFWKAIELNKSSHVSYYYLGQIYSSEGENDKALQHYLKAIGYAKQQGSDNEAYYIKTGESYFTLGMHLKAIDMFIASINSNIHHPLHSLLNNNLLTNQKNKILHLKDANSYDKEINLGNLYFTLGRYDEALIKYKTAIKINNTNANCHEYIGDIQIQIANYKSAEDYYLKAIALNNTDNYHHKLADLYLEYALVGENTETYYEKSINSYKEANSIMRSHLHYAGLGGAYYLSNRYEEALENYKFALKFLDKKSSKFNENREQHYIASLGNIYLKLGQFTQALSIFKQLLQTNPTQHSYHAGLAEVYASNKNNYPEAINKYIEAFDYSTTPAIKDFYVEKLIDLYAESGAHEEACERLKQRILGRKNYNNDIKNELVKIIPQILIYKHPSEFFAALGAIYFEHGFYIEATHAYAKAREHNKSEVAYYIEEARIYLELSNYASAIKVYQKLEHLSLCNDECYNNMGNAHFLSHDYSKAILYYAKAIINNPNKAIYYNDLGIAFYEAGNFQESVFIFEKLTKRESKNAIYLNNLGTSYYQLKLYHEAKKVVEQASNIDPDQLIYKLHLTKINSIININKYETNGQYSQFVPMNINLLKPNQLMSIHRELHTRTIDESDIFILIAITCVPFIGSEIGLKNFPLHLAPYSDILFHSYTFGGIAGFVKGLKSGLVSNNIFDLLYEGILGGIIFGSTGAILGLTAGIAHGASAIKYSVIGGISFSSLGYFAAIIRGTGSSLDEIITFTKDTAGSAAVEIMSRSILLALFGKHPLRYYSSYFASISITNGLRAISDVYPLRNTSNIILGQIISFGYCKAVSLWINDAFGSFPDIGIGLDTWSKGLFTIGSSLCGTLMGIVPCLVSGKNIGDCSLFAFLGSLGMNLFINKPSLIINTIDDESLKIITLDITESNTDIKEVDDVSNNFESLKTFTTPKEFEAKQTLINIQFDEKDWDPTYANHQKPLTNNKVAEESSVQALEILELLEKQNHPKSESKSVQSQENPKDPVSEKIHYVAPFTDEIQEQKELKVNLEKEKKLQESSEKQHPNNIGSEIMQTQENSINPQPAQINCDTTFTYQMEEEQSDFSIPDVNYDL